MLQTTNPAGYALIMAREGLRLRAYRDIAGVWTIGYGHTGGVYKGDTMTPEQAYQLLCQDLASREAWVNARATSPTPNQFAAMVSFTFNLGAAAFLGSSLRRLHNEGDFPSAADAFLLWDKAHVDGQLMTVEGLLARRQAERELYLTPEAAMLPGEPT